MFTNLVCARARSWRTRSFLPCRDVEEADDADGDGVGDGAAEGGRPHRGVAPRQDVADLRTNHSFKHFVIGLETRKRII